MPEVCIVPCNSYELSVLRSAITDALQPFGGLDWVVPGMKIGLKTNLVSGHKPETAVVTHPAVIAALTELLCERGAQVIVGDSPGGLYTAAFVNHVYRAAGMELAEKSGAVLNQNFDKKEALFPAAKVCRQFEYTAWLDECDAIIDVCKLKTHGMMGMSCAAKNMFGVIPGTLKPEYHFRFSDPADFADMLVDLNEYFKPKMRFCLVDAIVGMEGNGPTMGTPRPIGALLAAPSPHAVDLLCAHLIGLTKEQLPLLEAAFRRGLIPEKAADLDVLGDYAPFCINDYRNIAVRSSLQFKGKNGLVGKITGFVVRTCLRSRPKLKPSACIGCGKCAEICPVKAITVRKKQAIIQKSSCIRCFCCQEFCPVGAMKVHRPWIARLLGK